MDDYHVLFPSQHITFHLTYRNSHCVQMCAGGLPAAIVYAVN